MYSAHVFDLVAKAVVRPHMYVENPFGVEGIRQAHVDLFDRGTTGKLLVKSDRAPLK